MKSLVAAVFFGIVSSNLVAEDQSAELRKSVKYVRDIISGLEIYDQLDKKRLYGALTKSGAIEFKLQSSPLERPTSMIVGIATDGTIQEMEVKVYVTNDLNEKIRQIRRDIVVNEKDWVFEIIDNSRNYLVDIRLIRSRKDVALVEILHGFYYGYKSNPAFSSTNKATGHPSSHAPKQDGDSLAPIDVYNRFEILRKALWD